MTSLSEHSTLHETAERGFYSLGTIVYPWTSPIPVVFVEGDSSEMGTQFTRATKNLTRKNILFNLPSVERILRKSRIKKREYLTAIEDAITKYTLSEYLDEIQSIAEVAGLPYESVLLVNANVDVAAMTKAQPEDRFSCSAFAAWGKATNDSLTIAGHNDDGNRVMDQYSVLKIAKPKHGYPFLCPQVPGYLGYDCLVNAKQVFVCGTAVDEKMKQSESIHDGVPNWVMYRWLGQFSSNANDAERRLLASKNMTLKNWCFVSNGQGGRVIEATPKHHATMAYPSKTKDWIGLSTCVVCPELSRYVVRSKGPTSGVHRMASVKREVAKLYGKISPETAVDILSSHYDSSRNRTMASEHTPCRHMEFDGKFAGTCRCIIASFFGGSDGKESTRIDISLGNPCNGYWRQLYFDEKFNLKAGYDKTDKFEHELNRTLVAM